MPSTVPGRSGSQKATRYYYGRHPQFEPNAHSVQRNNYPSVAFAALAYTTAFSGRRIGQTGVGRPCGDDFHRRAFDGLERPSYVGRPTKLLNHPTSPAVDRAVSCRVAELCRGESPIKRGTPRRRLQLVRRILMCQAARAGCYPSSRRLSKELRTASCPLC